MENVSTSRNRIQRSVRSGDLEISPICKELAFYPPLLDLVQELYGEPACLFKDKLIFKKPGLRGCKMRRTGLRGRTSQEFQHGGGTVRAGRPPTAAPSSIRLPHHDSCPTRGRGYHAKWLRGWWMKYRRAAGVAAGDIAIFTAFTRTAPTRTLRTRWRRQLLLSFGTGCPKAVNSEASTTRSSTSRQSAARHSRA